MASLLGEIRRRKVFQVAAAYAVVAWLAVQIVATVEEPLSLPPWVDTLAIVLLALGFPIALLVSWAFNVTPDGFVRDAGGDRPGGDGGRTVEYVLIGLLAAAVLWLLYRDLGSPNESTDTVAEAAGAAAGTDRARAARPNSIAVLLCDNFSTDEQNAFFAASLHEEMLNQLVKLRNLSVTARTSVLQYSVAGAERPPIPRIAEELGVESVMECSVAYGDGRIVISVQLIDGGTGVHVWSERYNREFRDVFGIQADIAMNVANALAVEFSAEEQRAIEQAATGSPEAYALYLQALSLLNVDNAGAIELLERALSFDPGFASAHRQKSILHAAALVNSTGLDAADASARDEQIRLARLHAARAARADPSLASFEAVVANLMTWRWSEMLAVLDALPDPVGQGPTWLYSYAGEPGKAIARARRWVELDPKNWNSHVTLAIALAYAGDTAAAERVQREAIGLAPTVPLLRSWLAFIEIVLGDFESAGSELERAEQLLGANRPAVFLPELAYSYSRIGRRADAERILAEIEQAGDAIEIGAGGRAMIALARGDRAGLAEQLESAIARIESHQIDEGFWSLMNVRMNVAADPLLEEPRFVELRARLRGD